MDVKAMAKSKRSHSQHNQPRKPKPTSTPSPSTSAAAQPKDQKSFKKEQRERKQSSQKPSLPSNWDRFQEEEGEEDSEGEVGNNEKYDEVVKPKSKGGKYQELIDQANESRGPYCSSVPSLDDTLPDYYQGLAPMLAVRGESISWDGTDDFLLEDDGTNFQEHPYFSLDIKGLGEEIAKADLAKRLFIEEDLLPPESRSQTAKEADNRSSSKKPETFDEILSLYFEAELEVERQNNDNKDSKASGSVEDSASLPGVGISNLVHAGDTSLVSHANEHDSRPSSGFEASAVEVELDMLLDSFGGTKLADSPTHAKNNTSTKGQGTPVLLPKDNSVTLEASHEQHSLGTSEPALPASSSLDDFLDELLVETCEPDNKDGVLQPIETRNPSLESPFLSTSQSHVNPKSKVLQDDFDSWFDTI